MQKPTSRKSRRLNPNIPNKILAYVLYFLINLTVCFTSSLYCNPAFAETPHKTIGISQIVDHPTLDAVHQSMIQTLKAEGFEVGKNLTVIYENAQASMITVTQIANKLMSLKLDLAVGILTPSAQTLYFEAQKHEKKIPIISAIRTVVKIASEPSSNFSVILPIFTSDPVLIKNGVLAAVGYDYEDVGQETGRVVAAILNGIDAKTFLTHSPKKSKAVINSTFAKKIGFIIPRQLKFSEVHVLKNLG